MKDDKGPADLSGAGFAGDAPPFNSLPPSRLGGRRARLSRGCRSELGRRLFDLEKRPRASLLRRGEGTLAQRGCR